MPPFSVLRRPSLALAATALPLAANAQPPQRVVSDPGIISTAQRITPAGVQSVFTGRVGGVRFGATPGELWVAVPGHAYLLSWSDNRVLRDAPVDGNAGVYGIAYDPVSSRALIASVGKLPAMPAEGRQGASQPAPVDASVAQLAAFGAQPVTGRSASLPAAVFGPLGEDMAGGPAVARRPDAQGRRLAVLPLPANDRVAVLDVEHGTTLAPVPVGIAPIAAAISDDGAVAWVTTLGGRPPKANDRVAMQCCGARGERVRVDARGIAAEGALVRIDLARGVVTHTLTARLHPTAIAWNERAQRLYVANGNSDQITIVDTRGNAVDTTIAVAPFRERRIGLAPTALALSPDGRTLYVALGGINAVAVYDASGASLALRGLIPTGWYPSTLDVSADGKHVAIGTLLGVGSGTGTPPGYPGQRGRFVHAVRGSVHVVDAPTAAQLVDLTRAVAANNRLALGAELARRVGERVAAAAPTTPRAVAPRPVPERVGEPSPIQHVVYIVKENRTYDQVLGDLPRGDGDSSLTIYGRDVTPNHHALAEQFVTIDRFFATGGNSADGHQWLTQANETDYTLWPLYEGRSYPFDGADPFAYSSGGFLWEAAQGRGKHVAVFGEFAPSLRGQGNAIRTSLLEQYRASHSAATFRERFAAKPTRSEIPSLDRVLARDYPAYTVGVPDVVRADIVLDYLGGWEKSGAMPHLVIVQLPSDHTSGTTPGWCTPKACVADNDLALGRVVEGFSHSRFWSSMAIVIVEDDAQNGVDHVDGHRTVALVASPYAKRGAVDTTFYNHPSLVKTIELMLGLPALSMFDLVATDMRASFLGSNEAPDARPFTALMPVQSIYETNARTGSMTGPNAAERRAAAVASSRMRFDIPDAAPTEKLNRILWHDAKGWSVPYPAVKQSVFMPMTVDLADDEREEAEEREGAREKSAPTKSGALIHQGPRGSRPP